MKKPRVGIVIHKELRDHLFSAADWSRLTTLADVRATESANPINDAEAAAVLEGCDIGISSWRTPGPSETVLSRCPDLKLWIHAAGTVKHFYGPHLVGRDLRIASCKAANSRNVAEFVLGEIILGVRRALPNAAVNRLHPTTKPPGMKTLAESVIGIIGASETGRAVIELLRPFSCEVLVYDPFLDEAGARKLGVRRAASLDELCAASDVVSLHVPPLPSTRHMMGATQFRLMRDDAVFINISRGDCLDEKALIAELERGRLFAFLDITDPEPAAADSPLRKLPNVMLTSHIAGPRSVLFGRQVVEDIEATLRGGEPRHVITAEMLDRIA